MEFINFFLLTGNKDYVDVKSETIDLTIKIKRENRHKYVVITFDKKYKEKILNMKYDLEILVSGEITVSKEDIVLLGTKIEEVIK
jgi:hypothetical protein